MFSQVNPGANLADDNFRGGEVEGVHLKNSRSLHDSSRSPLLPLLGEIFNLTHCRI
jgi:hypothetical protein